MEMRSRCASPTYTENCRLWKKPSRSARLRDRLASAAQVYGLSFETNSTGHQLTVRLLTRKGSGVATSCRKWPATLGLLEGEKPWLPKGGPICGRVIGHSRQRAMLALVVGVQPRRPTAGQCCKTNGESGQRRA